MPFTQVSRALLTASFVLLPRIIHCRKTNEQQQQKKYYHISTCKEERLTHISRTVLGAC